MKLPERFQPTIDDSKAQTVYGFPFVEKFNLEKKYGLIIGSTNDLNKMLETVIEMPNHIVFIVKVMFGGSLKKKIKPIYVWDFVNQQWMIRRRKKNDEVLG